MLLDYNFAEQLQGLIGVHYNPPSPPNDLQNENHKTIF